MLLGETSALEGSQSQFSLLKGYVADTVSCPYRSHCIFFLPKESRFFSSTGMRSSLWTLLPLQGRNAEQSQSEKWHFLSRDWVGMGSWPYLANEMQGDIYWGGRCLKRFLQSYRMERHFLPSHCSSAGETPGVAGCSYFVTKRGVVSLLRTQNRKLERTWSLVTSLYVFIDSPGATASLS